MESYQRTPNEVTIELLDTQVFSGSVFSWVRPLEISSILPIYIPTDPCMVYLPTGVYVRRRRTQRNCNFAVLFFYHVAHDSVFMSAAGTVRRR